MAASDKETDGLLKCIEVMNCLPPKDAEQDLFRLTYMIPMEDRADYEENLFQKVDLPLKTKTCSKTGKNFIAGEYNRDGDSHRSPWSNVYEPAIDGGLKPSEDLRALEERFNAIFDLYRHQYFNKLGTSSVVVFSIGKSDSKSFAVTCCVKKELSPNDKNPDDGDWNSTHVVSCTKQSGERFEYKCISSLLLTISVGNKGLLGDASLSGTVQSEKTVIEAVGDKDMIQSHVMNIGKLVEEQETNLRGKISSIYFGKCNSIFQNMRHLDAQAAGREKKQANMFQEAMAKKLKKAT